MQFRILIDYFCYYIIFVLYLPIQYLIPIIINSKFQNHDSLYVQGLCTTVYVVLLLLFTFNEMKILLTTIITFVFADPLVGQNITSYSRYDRFSMERLRIYTERNENNAQFNNPQSMSRLLASSEKGHGHTAHSRHMHKPWSSLASVDGLRNDEVAMFVTSTAFKEGYFLRAR